MPLFPFPAPRLPTAGERALIEPLFGGVIDCNRLRIYRRRYLPFQAAATAQYGSLNDGETAALHDWYQSNHHRLTPDYCGMKWALLSWQTA